jgi:hypothetical protein
MIAMRGSARERMAKACGPPCASALPLRVDPLYQPVWMKPTALIRSCVLRRVSVRSVFCILRHRSGYCPWEFLAVSGGDGEGHWTEARGLLIGGIVFGILGHKLGPLFHY